MIGRVCRTAAFSMQVVAVAMCLLSLLVAHVHSAGFFAGVFLLVCMAFPSESYAALLAVHRPIEWVVLLSLDVAFWICRPLGPLMTIAGAVRGDVQLMSSGFLMLFYTFFLGGAVFLFVENIRLILVGKPLPDVPRRKEHAIGTTAAFNDEDLRELAARLREGPGGRP